MWQFLSLFICWNGGRVILNMSVSEDKHKDNGILLEQEHLLNLSKGVMRMAENDPELLNTVYKDISEKLGMDTAMEIYRMFKGQQISFPMRFFNPIRIQKCIIQEYDGTNVKTLAIKYNYSEKTVRRIIKESIED
jgi:Mor family transcriptional regulator